MSRIRFVLMPVLLLGPLILAQCAGKRTRASLPASDQFPNGEILVTPDWLNRNLDNPDVVIIDMRAPGSYAHTHIPGQSTCL